jgi:hypothetical protein
MIPGYENTLEFGGMGEDPNKPNIGYFVFINNQLWFNDANGKFHDLSRVLLMGPEWDAINGEKNIPKPYIQTETGEIQEYGANVLYQYINGENADIAVMGTVRRIGMQNLDPELSTDFSDIDDINKKAIGRDNKKRHFTFIEDGLGNLIIYLKGQDQNGNMTIKIDGNDITKNGNLKLELNGKCAINQVDKDGVTYAQLLFDNTDGDEKIKVTDKYKNIIELNKKGTIIETKTIRIGKDETVMKILTDLITAIEGTTQGTAAGGPTLTPLFNKAQFDAIQSRLNKFMDTQ